MKKNSYYPSSMKSLPNWVLWKLVKFGDRPTKVPFSALYNGKASSTNPETWTTFDNALSIYEHDCARAMEYSGLGFVFHRDANLVFIDIDHCINEEGELNETANHILALIGDYSYIELSQSGTGLHLFTKGSIPKGFNNRDKHVEMYCEGRFVAMTGNPYPYTREEPSLNKESLLALYEEYKTKDLRHKKESRHTQGILSLSDELILQKASENDVSGDTFRKLYSGDFSGYPSQSEGELRLCTILAFWSNRDYTTIDRLFRSSGAYREKWEREDYRIRTISIACDSLVEDLSEYIERVRKEEQRLNEETLLRYW